MHLPFDLSSAQAIYLAAALIVAAFIRGYSGFGFSAIIIASAALVTNPVPLIPVVFTCEIAMTAFQARGIRPHIDWSRALTLLAGTAVAIVPAVWLMAQLGEQQARFAISGLIFVLSAILISGWQLRRPVGRWGNFGIGIIAGTANSAGVGGLPTAAFLAAQPIPPAIFRATMIVFLTGVDLLTLPVMASHGLVTADTGRGILMAFPLLGFGIWLGTRAFGMASQSQFRRLVVLALGSLSILNIVTLLI